MTCTAMILLRAAQRFCHRSIGVACRSFFTLIFHATELILPWGFGRWMTQVGAGLSFIVRGDASW